MDFTLPEDLTGLDDAALIALRDQAMAEGTALSTSETFSSADADRLDYLSNGVDVLDAELARRAEADAALAARQDAAKAKFAKPAAAPAAEPVVEDVVEGVVVDEPAPVVAAAPAARTIVRKAPAPVITPTASTPARAIVAAADLGTEYAGRKVDSLVELVPGLAHTIERVRTTGANGARAGLYSIQLPEERLVGGRNTMEDTDIVSKAVEDYLKRVTEETAVVAAGGWCAPTPLCDYDLCAIAQAWPGFDLPRVSAPRGSFSFFRNIDYSAFSLLLDAGIGCYTDAELQAEPPLVKPCFELPCNDGPATVVLDACSICIRVGILSQKAWPELFAEQMRLVEIKWDEFLNQKRWNDALALATDLGVLPGTFGALAQFLSSVTLQAINLRYDEHRDENALVEIAVPFWVPELFQAEMTRRQFDADWNFTAGQIATALAARNIRIQYVKYFDDAPFAGAGPVTTWPAEIPVLMWFPGAIIEAYEPIISVGTLVDSTLLQTNRQQVLFVEQAQKVYQGCGSIVRFRVPVCPSGETAGPVDPVGTNVCPAP
jgi:hypothetical protein